MFYADAVEKLMTDMKDKDLSVGTLYTTGEVICQSAAGFYLGEWCVEVEDFGLIPQPYARHTDYMTREDAEIMWTAINDVDALLEE